MKKPAPEAVERMLREFAVDLDGFLDAYPDLPGQAFESPWRTRAKFVRRAIDDYCAQQQLHTGNPAKFDKPDIAKAFGLIRTRQGRVCKEEQDKHSAKAAARYEAGRRINELKAAGTSWEALAESEGKDIRTLQRMQKRYLDDPKRLAAEIAAGVASRRAARRRGK